MNTSHGQGCAGFGKICRNEGVHVYNINQIMTNCSCPKLSGEQPPPFLYGLTSLFFIIQLPVLNRACFIIYVNLSLSNKVFDVCVCVCVRVNECKELQIFLVRDCHTHVTEIIFEFGFFHFPPGPNWKIFVLF